MELGFVKWEGLGNDFVIIDGGREVTRDQAVAICDRHFGVGADGVLMVGVATHGRAFMRVVNADGSTPEMCGNGLRCVALYLRRSGVVATDAFEVDTDAGPHLVEVLGDEVTVAMAVPSLDPERVPVRADTPWIDAPFEVDGRTLHVTAVSMGNPHAVFFDALDPAACLALGPTIERDARFPERVNVGFARVHAATKATDEGGAWIELAVFERGAGWTLACGTGACAAAVAAVETGRAKRHTPIRVTLPGGPMTIVVGERGARVSMTGPAREVYRGHLDLDAATARLAHAVASKPSA